MRVVSVNVGMPALHTLAGEEVYTGIVKVPQPGRVVVNCLGLTGDGQGNREVHGGVDKAVYAYSLEHYTYWSEKLGGSPMELGTFGENLTLSNADESEVCIGDRLANGNLLLEVTQPRIPCETLAKRMARPGFPKEFLKSGRTGFYLRVLSEGEIGAGDTLQHLPFAGTRMSIRELCHIAHFDTQNRSRLTTALELPGLSLAWKQKIAKLLSRLV